MLYKEKVKLTRVEKDGKRTNKTYTISGRTPEELKDRVQRHTADWLRKGYKLR